MRSSLEALLIKQEFNEEGNFLSSFTKGFWWQEKKKACNCVIKDEIRGHTEERLK